MMLKSEFVYLATLDEGGAVRLSRSSIAYISLTAIALLHCQPLKSTVA